nr:translation initiation factor IF-2-like [Caretta caretta]
MPRAAGGEPAPRADVAPGPRPAQSGPRVTPAALTRDRPCGSRLGPPSSAGPRAQRAPPARLGEGPRAGLAPRGGGPACESSRLRWQGCRSGSLTAAGCHLLGPSAGRPPLVCVLGALRGFHPAFCTMK